MSLERSKPLSFCSASEQSQLLIYLCNLFSLIYCLKLAIASEGQKLLACWLLLNAETFLKNQLGIEPVLLSAISV